MLLAIMNSSICIFICVKYSQVNISDQHDSHFIDLTSNLKNIYKSEITLQITFYPSKGLWENIVIFKT